MCRKKFILGEAIVLKLGILLETKKLEIRDASCRLLEKIMK